MYHLRSLDFNCQHEHGFCPDASYFAVFNSLALLDYCNCAGPCRNGGVCLTTGPGLFDCVCNQWWRGEVSTETVFRRLSWKYIKLSRNFRKAENNCTWSFVTALLKDDISEQLWKKNQCLKCHLYYQLCENDIDECSLENPCRNGGTCVNQVRPRELFRKI